MAMPWSRAKQVARALRGKDEFPENYHGSRTTDQLTELFDACFCIQREAIEAAGHHIPMIVENVRGAQPWVGRSRANFGSFHLWGDVPALMPIAKSFKVPGFRFDGSGVKGTKPYPNRGWTAGVAITMGLESYNGVKGFTPNGEPMGKNTLSHSGSKSKARKAASAAIAKIPFPLASYIARVYRPERSGE